MGQMCFPDLSGLSEGVGMKALICGVTGQDGGYLAKFLLEKGYEVVGTSRDVMATSSLNLERLGIKGDFNQVSMAINDLHSVLAVVRQHCPNEIYNLAGQSSVGLSFEQPAEALDSISKGTLNLLEAVRFVAPETKLYNAGSSECFGDTGHTAANENTPFSPRSPYAVAKASAHWLVQNYRTSYDLFASTGMLFNHESPLRPPRFVTQKIVRSAAQIASTGKGSLELGNVDIYRDWGWAPEYVQVMWLMLQQQQPADYVVATGRSCSLEHFVERSFQWFGLDWRDYVRLNNDLRRPSDIKFSRGDPALAATRLGWKAKLDVDGVIDVMCAEISRDF
jgi:GDPmannose 4,6-dehydratase